MIEEEIQKKRKELDQSIENNQNYDDVYRLSIELDNLIAEFYKESKEKQMPHCIPSYVLPAYQQPLQYNALP